MRVIAIQGVCSICNAYWELIPANVIQAFLRVLVEELAWDTASAIVRVAVIKVIFIRGGKGKQFYIMVCMCL